MRSLEDKRCSLTLLQMTTILSPHSLDFQAQDVKPSYPLLGRKTLPSYLFLYCYLFFGSFLKMDSFCAWLFKGTRPEKSACVSKALFFFSKWFFFCSLELEANEGLPGALVAAASLLAFFQRAQANLPIMSLESKDEVPDNMTQISLLLLLISS